MSLACQLAYGWHRGVLRKRELLAQRLPLGMQLEVHVPDDVGRRIYKYQVHEPWYLQWLEEQRAPARGELALDVGANIGWYSVLFHRLSAGRLRVHGFEPDPVNHALLRRNLQRNGIHDAELSALALGAEDGQATLYQHGVKNLGKHSLQPLTSAAGTTRVAVTTLDGYLAARGWDQTPIWIMKLDVEGHEPAVLAGAREALGQTRALMLEYSPELHRPEAASAMLEQLQAEGFRPSLYTDGSWQPSSIRRLAALQTQRDTLWTR
ncbi:MAG: FkbM family methyltransferase [Xanthomonadales bacterium]|nr:FkbM family methyltransferase [Xanthomonadales bacterium]